MLIVYVSFVKTLILIKFQFQFRISWKTSMSWWGRLRIWEPKFLYDSTLKNVWKANNHLPKNISRLGPIPFTSGIKFSSSHGSSPSPEGLCTWQSDSKFQWVGILSNTGWCLIKPRRFWMMPRVKPNGVRAAKPKKKIKPVDRFINFTSPLVNVCTAPIVPKCPTKATNFPVPVPNVTFPKDVRS